MKICFYCCRISKKVIDFLCYMKPATNAINCECYVFLSLQDTCP